MTSSKMLESKSAMNDIPAQASLHKEASPILAGVLGHVGTNAAAMGAHGLNAAERMAHKGLQQGLGGATLNPFARLSTRLIGGAEALGAYDAAHALAKKIQHLPTEQQRLYLAAANIPASAAIGKDTPVLGALQSAVKHELAGTSPELARLHPHRSGMAGVLDRGKELAGRGQHWFLDKMTNLTETPFDTAGKKVVTSLAGAAPAVALGAIDPAGAAVHYGVNAARMAAGETDWGKNLALSQMKKGLSGQEMSEPGRAIKSLLISPGLAEMQDMGSSVRKNLQQNLGSYGTAIADRASAIPAGGSWNAKHILTGKAPSPAPALPRPPTPSPLPQQQHNKMSLLPAAAVAAPLALSAANSTKEASYGRMIQKLADGTAHETEEYEPRSIFQRVGYGPGGVRSIRGNSLVTALALGAIASRVGHGL